jgi:hypothetical protein
MSLRKQKLPMTVNVFICNCCDQNEFQWTGMCFSFGQVFVQALKPTAGDVSLGAHFAVFSRVHVHFLPFRLCVVIPSLLVILLHCH